MFTLTKARDERFMKVIDGYLRMENRTLNMNIPQDINIVILLFYKKDIDSKILTDDEEATLYEMVLNRLQVKEMNFIPVYQGTKDGFGFDDFWSKCYGIKPAFVIIETRTNEVFGGYASIGLNSNKPYGKDKRAFLYSIRNAPKYPPKIIQEFKACEDKAILFSNGFLCCFNMSELWLQSDCDWGDERNGCLGTGFGYYTRTLTQFKNEGHNKPFKVKELELFRVIPTHHQ